MGMIGSIQTYEATFAESKDTSQIHVHNYLISTVFRKNILTSNPDKKAYA